MQLSATEANFIRNQIHQFIGLHGFSDESNADLIVLTDISKTDIYNFFLPVKHSLNGLLTLNFRTPITTV
jgi:hypothetical protein